MKKVIELKRTTREYSLDGNTILFYQKEGDDKFSFLIKGNEELTKKLLDNVKTKRVKQKDIHYAVTGIFQKIKELESQDSSVSYYNEDGDLEFICSVCGRLVAQLKTLVETADVIR